jgi:pimeloyl-ACP methyl ester carboxylesterase
MTRLTPARELFTVTAGSATIPGTHHKCAGQVKPTGVLMFNTGFLPRSSDADSGVYWADCFARSGYPVFRVDLPGLGDAAGRIPQPLLEFINGGGYGPVLSAVVRELTARYELGGIVLMGHCAGAVTAMYTAALTPECKGVVLTDPYFHLEHEKADLVVAFKDWVMWGPMAKLTRHLFHALRSVYLLAKRLRTTGTGSGNLPANANIPMLRGCKKFLSGGVPMLVLQSPRWSATAAKGGHGQFDYLGYVQASAGSKARMAVVSLNGIDHSFANSAARKAVLENTGQWLQKHFPPQPFKEQPEDKPARLGQIYAHS